MEVVRHFHDRLPLLGVCLGHQALGMFFGGQLVHTPPMHGKTSAVTYVHHPMFSGVPNPFTVMRYHSLAIEGLGDTGLLPLAYAHDGVLMAMCHHTYPCIGVQFHPESVGTECGQQLLNNWAAMRF